MARGIDFKVISKVSTRKLVVPCGAMHRVSIRRLRRSVPQQGVNMVINYDFPQSAVSYIHRIGRTGRAGRHGVAVTLFTESDMDSLRSVANVMRLSGCEVKLNTESFNRNAVNLLVNIQSVLS